MDQFKQPPPSSTPMLYKLKTIIALTFSQNEVSAALVNVKSHLTTSSEPAIRICGEESNIHLPVKRPEDRPWLREQRTDQYQLKEALDYIKH